MRAELARIVGSEHVLDGGDRRYLSDATVSAGEAGPPARADAIVLPGSPEEAAAVVAWCYPRGVAIVPRGGGTGYAGGVVPDGGVVVATDRLTRVRALETPLWRMHVDAGVTTAIVRRRAREEGGRYPPDPGAAEQSHIGGNVATNAGGPHCFRHGVTRAWVLGVEAVLAPGELVTVGGPVRKDVAGYDLTGLLCGSEGTLGLITGAWLRLVPAPATEPTVLAGFFRDAREGQEALHAVLSSGAIPGAVEYLDAGALRASGAAFPGTIPPGAAFALLVEAEEPDDVPPLREALGHPGEPDARALWRWRDGVSIAVTAVRGGKLSEDVAVPVDRLAEAVNGVVSIGAAHGLDACSWGHAGDGNLHATFLLDPGDATMRARADAAAEEVFTLAAALGGTVSGEHGLGRLKSGRLALQWREGALRAHEAVKAALDPAGLFNPGKKLARRP